MTDQPEATPLSDEEIDIARRHAACDLMFCLGGRPNECEALTLDDEAIIDIVMQVGMELADHDLIKADVPYAVREEIARRKGTK